MKEIDSNNTVKKEFSNNSIMKRINLTNNSNMEVKSNSVKTTHIRL